MSKDNPVDYGTGAIYQAHDHPSCPPRIDGVRPEHQCRGRWVGTIEAGWTAAGVRRRVKVTGKTEAAVRRNLHARKAKIDAEGLPSANAAHRTRVKPWADQWIERQRRKVRPNALTADASAIRKWIVPTIGHKRIADLTPGDVRAVENAIRAANRSGSTANRVHGTLHKMLKDALVDGYPVPTRILEMGAPERSISDRDALPVSSALAILAEALDRPDASRWVAALLQGMRPGECLGLRWSCVDLERGRLDISWQRQELPFDHGCGGTCRYKTGGRCPKRRYRAPDTYKVIPMLGAVALVRPKTKKGNRIIPLVPWMTAALTDWRDHAPHSPHDLVWPDADGQPRNEKVDRQDWIDLQVAAGVVKAPAPPPTVDNPNPEPVRWTLYEARHTAATLLAEAGVDDQTITQIMGHTSILTTRGYQHVDDRAARAALSKIATRLGLVTQPAGELTAG